MCVRTSLLYLILQLVFVACQPDNFGELIFTIVLYRHGDRTILGSYPNDPYKNRSLWPAPWGQLTDNGKRGQYALGKWLRDRYRDFLPEMYNVNDIHVQSTDVDRTLMSAYCNLAGLYEPKENLNWNPNILWNPIPVHTIPESLDKVLAAGAPCPKYKLEIENIMNSSTFRKVNEKYKELYGYLTEMSGMHVENVDGVQRLYDTLLIEEIYNFKLPSWTKKVYPEPMKEISALYFTIPCFTKTAARLQIGPLFNEMLTNMEKKIAGHLDKKMWMYSGHDKTVASVLKGLGVFQPHSPPYLSTILLELMKRNEEYFVVVYYKNSSSIPPYLMQLPGCEKFCPFGKFKKLLSPLIPDNWEEECREIQFVENMFDSTASINFMTAVSLALLFFLSVVIVLKFYRSQRKNQSNFAYTILKMDATS